MSDKFRETFLEEARELLLEMETGLLELEESPDDELICRVFRALHTIKGSGAMFGLEDISSFTHEVETVFDKVRNKELGVSKELIDLILAAKDYIRLLLDGDNPVDNGAGEEIIKGLRILAGMSEENLDKGTEPNQTGKMPEYDSENGLTLIYRIRFKPNADALRAGSNPIILLNELRELGESRIVSNPENIPSLLDLVPENCYTSWDIILTTCRGINEIKDVFLFIEDNSEIKIEIIDNGIPLEESGQEMPQRIGEILVARGDVKEEDMVNAAAGQKRIGEILVEKGLSTPANIESALAEQEMVKKVHSRGNAQDSSSSIRVPADKLDSLVNLVGELVIIQARLTQMVTSRKDKHYFTISEEIERLTTSLRNNALSVRMLHIGSTFSKFKRLVRDLSNELGRQVELTTEGAETELDKTVIERLSDPLVHLIRNSIDHGIEPPEQRLLAGKPAKGNIHLSAAHAGAYVVVKISDDGAGINPEVIRKKGIEKGLITPDMELTKNGLFNLIFTSGFSTAEKISSVSGRGVGMDVVKRNIEALRGSIEVESEVGGGTVISIKLPLTLAIIEGFQVEIGGDTYVLPLSTVEECITLSKKETASGHDRNLTIVRGEIIPYMRLREFFKIDGIPPEVEQIVIIKNEEKRVGLVVDYIIGARQTVIKPLGKIYRNVEGISGATILGDGSIALILDIYHLVKIAEQEELMQVNIKN